MRNETNTKHLTDDEFSRLLDGAQPGAYVEAHLAACELCRQEVEVVQGSLTSFRTLGTVWAETVAPRRVLLPARWTERFGVQTSWSAGLVTTAMTGVVMFWLGFAPHTRITPSVHAPVPSPTNAELAADNRLLLSIDEELNDQGQPVATAAQVEAEPRHSTHRQVSSLTD